MQCKFYDPNVHHECREPQADFVSEKDQANFCDYFVFGPRLKVQIEDARKAKEKLEGLFKRKR